MSLYDCYLSHIASGVMDDGEGSPYVPGVNCWDCGRFVGRDGWIEIEYFEMSNSIASVSGQCKRCGDRSAADYEGPEVMLAATG